MNVEEMTDTVSGPMPCITIRILFEEELGNFTYNLEERM